jgi:hypothetical protein
MSPLLPFDSFAGAAQLVMAFFAVVTMLVNFALCSRA